MVPDRLLSATFASKYIDKMFYVLGIEVFHVVFRELQRVKGDARRASILQSAFFFGFGIFQLSYALSHSRELG